MTSQLESVLAFLGDRAPAGVPDTMGNARVVLVGSGKGGAGTSTVACLLALVAAEAGENVLLIDGSDGMGVQHLLLGIDGEGEILPERIRRLHPGEEVQTVSKRLSLIQAPIGAEAAGRPNGDRRTAFRKLGSLYGGHDLVVIDGGSRLESVHSACEGGISLLLAVTTTDRISLAATYALVKSLGPRMGERPVLVLANRVDDGQGREAAGLVDSATRHFIHREVGYAGAIPEDACLHAGVAAGMCVQDAAAGSPAATAMLQIMRDLLDEVPSARPDKGRPDHPWR